LTRSVALLAMGLIEVNRGTETTLGPDWWGLLAFICIILAWAVVPQANSVRRNVLLSLKIVGIIGITVLFAIYRSTPVKTEVLFLGEVDQWTWLRTQWWGILGLIGWAYLTVASIYFLLSVLRSRAISNSPSLDLLDQSGDQEQRPSAVPPVRREWLVAAGGLLMLLFLVSQHGGFFTRLEDKPWLGGSRVVFVALSAAIEFINRYVDLGTQLGSLPAVMMAGCVLGTVLLPDSDVGRAKDRLGWALTYSFFLFVAGLMTDTFAGINKISGTPAWCFHSACLATLSWIFLFAILDIWRWQQWAAVIQPAGANPLIAYLLHPILLFSLSISELGGFVRFYNTSNSSMVAVIGSIIMALVICLMTGLIARAGLRLRV
jgi:heparan-alpha-glucosaminide N-acetyltransferase